MSDDLEIIPSPKSEIVLASGVGELMKAVRAEWKDKRLIQRVQSLLPTDPSSACQRIFNAAIHDLRNKIVVAGIDIAKEAATRFRLPSVNRPEDVLDAYSVTHLIDLAYRMGLLSRPEWRRLHRCYEIRRDLEHEDDEYEATVEDCIYIFRTCVEVILSQDPVELIKLSDVRDAISSPSKFTPSATMIADFEKAPDPRQFEIIDLLVNTALDSGKADIVRQNAMELLRSYKEITLTTVKLKKAEEIQQRLSKKPLDMTTAKVAYASGLLPYLKQRQVREFFDGFAERFETVGHHWTQFAGHEKLFDDFEDVGAFAHCPPETTQRIVLWCTLCYLGEPGGYGMGRNRPVFYSNSAAPRIVKLFKRFGGTLLEAYETAKKDKRAKAAVHDKHIARRAERLLEILIEKEKAEA